eukprot:3609468-Pyramimonas_sp.AAC.1
MDDLQKQFTEFKREAGKSGSITSGSTGTGTTSNLAWGLAKGLGKGVQGAWSASKIEIKEWVVHWKDPPM